MSKKLWRVKLEGEAIAYAESEEEAIAMIRQEPEAHSQMFDCLGGEAYADEITSDTFKPSLLPDGWDAGCIPWGSGRDLTIRDIIERLRKEQR